jgi:hypothetical protein
LAVAALAASLSACSQDDTSDAASLAGGDAGMPSDTATDTVSDTRAPSDASPDLSSDVSIQQQISGEWITAGGDGTLSCGGDELNVSSGPTGRLFFEQNRLHFDQGDGCVVEFNSTGEASYSVVDGASCTQSVDGVETTIDIQSWSLTYLPGDRRIEQDYDAETTTTRNNSTDTCTIDWQGTLKPKPPKDFYEDEFVGTWTKSSEPRPASYSCPDSGVQSILEQTPIRPETIDISTAADTSISIEFDALSSTCALTAQLDGRDATISADQTCSFASNLVPEGDITRITGASTLELSSDNGQLTLTYDGTIDPGDKGSCDESFTFRYTPSN